MTGTTLLILVILFLLGCFFLVYLYDRKLVKDIAEYEKRLDEKGILKRHFSKPISWLNKSLVEDSDEPSFRIFCNDDDENL